jgi:hypothetical protein
LQMVSGPLGVKNAKFNSIEHNILEPLRMPSLWKEMIPSPL